MQWPTARGNRGKTQSITRMSSGKRVKGSRIQKLPNEPPRTFFGFCLPFAATAGVAFFCSLSGRLDMDIFLRSESKRSCWKEMEAEHGAYYACFAGLRRAACRSEESHRWNGCTVTVGRTEEQVVDAFHVMDDDDAAAGQSNRRQKRRSRGKENLRRTTTASAGRSSNFTTTSCQARP